MGMISNSEKQKKANSIYKESKNIFGNILDNWSDDVIDEEEREFYRIVSNFFLQQRQKEVVRKGKF